MVQYLANETFFLRFLHYEKIYIHYMSILNSTFRFWSAQELISNYIAGYVFIKTNLPLTTTTPTILPGCARIFLSF